ncbi:MAG: Ig-like domain-containing protein [Clostridiales Family XIII bacterium]|jgi:hypothetical protein|nr:Ig-like domain-containing protein [Clostridiales Family XIII bacterium]
MRRFTGGKLKRFSKPFGSICLIAAILILAQPFCSAPPAAATPCGVASHPVSGTSPTVLAAYAEDGQEQEDEQEDGEDADRTPEAVDSSTLEEAITEAEDVKKDVRPSTDGTDIGEDNLWAPQAAFNSLNASIKEAKETLKDEVVAQKAVDDQTAALKAAVKTFTESCKYGTKTDEEEVSKEVVNALYLKNDEPGSDGQKHFVGEDSDSKYKTLSITTKGKTIQLNGYFTTNKSDGVMYETADDTNPVGAVALDWTSGDNDIATVSPNGLITAIEDGEVTITATVAEESKYEGSAPSKSVSVLISGQTAEYVSDVAIIDEKGNSLSDKDDVTTVIEGKNKFFSFHARVTWHNPKTDEDRVEDTRTDEITSTIKWSVGGSNVVATVNEDTGRLKTTEYSGNCFVRCSVTGGNGGKRVTDTARVTVDTGEYAYKPAENLTLKVVYRELPDKVAQTHTYALSELAGKLSAVTNSYSILGGDRYGVIRASGYLFKDVLALEGVEIEDVYQFRFTTADGYDNPITSKLLYDSGSRYYFPNWDIGSRAGATVVPPMLAFESNMMWGESMADPSLPLDEGTRFRLVFGPLWGGEANSSYQIYYIQAITIVLNGAPPAENEKPEEDGEKENDDAEKEGEQREDEVSVVGEEDGDGGAAGTVGKANGRNGGENSGGGENSDDDAKSENDSVAGGIEDSPGSDKKAEMGGKKDAGSKSVIPFSSSGRFKVYEMISNTRTNVAPIDMDLPGLYAAGPLAGGCVVAGGLSFLIGFKRRLP